MQTIYRASPTMTVTAVSPDFSDFQSRQSNDIAPMGRGYEYVLDAKLVGNAPKWGEEAVQKLTAKPVEVGRYDLVLHPSHLWLTIHESIAHPTELDRAMGYEANYAGTSFVAPPEKMLGKFKYGPEFMNIQGDRIAGRVRSATIGWDDEGVKPDDVPHHQERHRQRLPDDARAGAAGSTGGTSSRGKPTRSHGCSYAQSWGDVQFQRMPNVSLLPGEKDLELGGPHRGDGRGHRDHRRRLVLDRPAALQRAVRRPGVLRDQGRQDRRHAQGRRVPDAHAGLLELDGHDRRQGAATGWAARSSTARDSRRRSNAVSHGCVPARFRSINVINTGRKA